jgi:hypothetical protein
MILNQLLLKLACVMNIITHSHAYALYPRGTLVERKTMYTKEPPAGSRASQALAKYEKRGWTRTDDLTGIEGSSEVRRVGDGACWTIRLNDSPEAGCVLSTNTWGRFDSRMSKSLRSPPRGIQNRALRFRYTMADGWYIERLVMAAISWATK